MEVSCLLKDVVSEGHNNSQRPGSLLMRSACSEHARRRVTPLLRGGGRALSRSPSALCLAEPGSAQGGGEGDSPKAEPRSAARANSHRLSARLPEPMNPRLIDRTKTWYINIAQIQRSKTEENHESLSKQADPPPTPRKAKQPATPPARLRTAQSRSGLAATTSAFVAPPSLVDSSLSSELRNSAASLPVE